MRASFGSFDRYDVTVGDFEPGVNAERCLCRRCLGLRYGPVETLVRYTVVSLRKLQDRCVSVDCANGSDGRMESDSMLGGDRRKIAMRYGKRRLGYV